MGHPKKQRKKYESPKKPYDKSRIESEKKIKQIFGLRRKHEIWRAEGILRNFRRRARELQAIHDETAKKMLFEKLRSIGLPCSSLEDVLELKLEDILSRRLQTIIHKKGFANSIKHARQLIVHGHVYVAGKRIVWPSYIVKKNEEDKITLNPKIIKEKGV
ncbi:MAG: 30S ribosomal protein S4 [Candidatus Aenigmatarchaeota archaeon]